MQHDTANLLKKLEGVTVALVTPLDADGQLDVPALERLIERVIGFGACCVFPLGWCGEQPMLTDRVRIAMLRETARIVNRRIPVMAGVSEQGLSRVLEAASIAAHAGADMILATPPYSYPIPQSFVLDFFRELARDARLPLVIYQNDELSVRVDVSTIEQLSGVSGIIGIKAFMPYEALHDAYRLANRAGEFAVMSGSEYQFGPALLMGIRHFTMGSPGNFCLKWCIATHRSGVEGKWGEVRERHDRLVALFSALCRVPAPFMAVKKYVMSRLGICSPHVTRPVRLLSPAEQKLVDAIMGEYAELLDPRAKENT